MRAVRAPRARREATAKGLCSRGWQAARHLWGRIAHRMCCSRRSGGAIDATAVSAMEAVERSLRRDAREEIVISAPLSVSGDQTIIGWPSRTLRSAASVELTGVRSGWILGGNGVLVMNCIAACRA
jgi:hypothetical protein